MKNFILGPIPGSGIRAALALAVLLFPHIATAGVDECTLLVPHEVASAATKKFPRFRMPTSMDYRAADGSQKASQEEGGCMGIVTGRFDRSGRPGYLIGMASKTDRTGAVVIALPKGKGWRVELLDEWNDDRAPLFVASGGPGEYKRADALGGPVDSAKGEVLEFTCKNDVAIFGAIRSKLAAFCRKGSRWSHAWVSN